MKSTVVKQLDGMKGRHFMYNTKTYHFLNYEIGTEGITIVTDKKFFKNIDPDTIETMLKEFLPIETPALRQEVAPVPMQSISNGTIGKLKDILLDNIEKVKEDPNYIPQAQAVASNVDSIINLSRAEMEAYRLAVQLKKMSE